MIYERIKQLCDKNGISVSELERRVGVSRGSICKIDKHKPSSETVEKIAVELNSNFDYVYKGKENEFTDEQVSLEIEIVDLYKKLNQEQRLSIYNLMLSMANTKEK